MGVVLSNKLQAVTTSTPRWSFLGLPSLARACPSLLLFRSLAVNKEVGVKTTTF